MAKEKKGVRLEHISKIYKDPKSGKDFYAVQEASRPEAGLIERGGRSPSGRAAAESL